MVPPPQSARIFEMLDTIRADFDQLTQEAYICKSQRDEYENKIANQIKEMNKFQQNIYELERSQQKLKKQYEDEIARLRHLLENPGASATSNGHSPMKQDQPPNIGPGSNYFGSIMSANHGAGLVAPSQMESQKQQQQQPYGGYNKLENRAIKPSQQSPSPHQYNRSPPKPQQLVQTSNGDSNMVPTTISLADIDPHSLPDSLKMEGLDWFALFNPKVKKSLKINLLHSLQHNSVVCCVKFSMDGRYMAAGCNRVTYIYDVATGQKISALQDESISQEGDLYIRSVCFSPDGRFLATGDEDKLIRIWDIPAKRIRNVLRGHEQDIYSLDFSRDGRILASGSGDRTTRIWNMMDGSCLHVLRITDANQKDPGVTSVAISYDGRLVATGSLDKMVRVWDTHTGQLMEQLEGHRDSVYSVAFMPNENELISGSLDKTIKLWKLGTTANVNRGFVHSGDRLAKNPCKMTFYGHKDFVLSIACSHDGKWIVSGSKDRNIQFWDPKTGQPQFMLQGHKNSVISVAVTSGGSPLFASGSGDNHARIWSYSTM